MLNKKLLIITSVIASIFSASASAKTEGNYVGVSLINTNVKSKSTFSEVTHRDDNFSLGVDYKYAFNFGGIFITPGIFYDHNALKTNHSAGIFDPTEEEASQLLYSYGAKVNIGYDVNDKFAPFVTLGHMQTRESFSFITSKYTETNEAFLFGAGFKYSVSDKIDVNLSYESVQKELSRNIIEVARGTDKINPTFSVIRLGASYNF